MKTYESIAAVADDIRRFFYTNESKLPDHVASKLRPLVGHGTSPVDMAVTFSEVVYANQADVPKEALEIAAGAALECNNNGFHGMNQDGRGEKMAKVMDGQKGIKAPAAKSEHKKLEEGTATETTPPK